MRGSRLASLRFGFWLRTEQGIHYLYPRKITPLAAVLGCLSQEFIGVEPCRTPVQSRKAKNENAGILQRVYATRSPPDRMTELV